MRTAALLAALWLSPSASEAAKPKDDRAHHPTRSIYLPVEIAFCGHLRGTVLYQDGQAVSRLPAKRIFQFTYYPELSRVEPLRSDLRVEGLRGDGSRFSGKLAVTPWGVFTADYRIELDMDEQLEKMKSQLDVRYHTVHVRVRCADSCGRAAVTAYSASPLEQ
jgi:hypothetical protein